jgi:Na+-driven multidrug efflux pump
MVGRILSIGVPSCIENSFFQLGKLLLARVITVFGTAAIAANAVTGSIAAMIWMIGSGFGLAMVTVVGQCVGAGDYDGARRYTKKLMLWTYIVCGVMALLIFFFKRPMLGAFNLSPAGMAYGISFLSVYCFGSLLGWPLGFALPNALRAAGDAKYVMIVAACTMWFVRICLALLLCYPLHFGPLGVWIAMITDFFARAAFYVPRWHGTKWQTKAVI